MKLRIWIIFIMILWVLITWYFIHSKLTASDTVSSKDKIKVDKSTLPSQSKSWESGTNSTQVEQQKTRSLPFVKLRHTKQSCGQWFDYEYLERWNATLKELCKPSSNGAFLSCRQIKNPWMPAATRPHVFCDAGILTVNPRKITPASCVKHRPNYFCGKKTYNAYQNGAFSVACGSSGSLRLGNFPRDHLMDNFDAMAFDAETPSRTLPITALLITRERGEHVNMYHATSDFFNAWMMMRIFNLDPHRTQVVLLDNHSPGPLDEFLTIFSPEMDILRASRLGESTSWQRAIFSPPGYSNIFLSRVTAECGGCCEKLKVVEDFSAFVLGSFGISRRTRREETTKVLLITRRPYRMKSVDHSFVGRQYDNEEELVRGLKSIKGAQVTTVDFAGVPLRKQLEMVAGMDIVVGMHGAGLTHVLWLPPWGALVELFPKASGKWHCFRHIALWRGLKYESWTARSRGFRKDNAGDYTVVDVNAVKEIVQKLHRELPAVR